MALLSKKTEEEKAQEAAERERNNQEVAERKAAEQAEKDLQAFLASPAGEARTAYQNGDHLFQYSIDVLRQKAIVHSMASLAPTGAKTKARTNDPTEILNAVCDEGWELVNGSFVFAEEGTVSRKQALSSKVQEAVTGTVLGYYLFKRCEANNKQVES